MREAIMYMGIGFLLAALIGGAVLPLVLGRAARLTTRRLETAPPQSRMKIQADKDLLRAEFATSMRRLEISVEQLKNKIASQVAELGKKGDAINRLEVDREALNVEVLALKVQIEAAADSTELAKQASLVPVAPTLGHSVQQDTWTRDDCEDDALRTTRESVQQDTWIRDRYEDVVSRRGESFAGRRPVFKRESKFSAAPLKVGKLNRRRDP